MKINTRQIRRIYDRYFDSRDTPLYIAGDHRQPFDSSSMSR